MDQTTQNLEILRIALPKLAVEASKARGHVQSIQESLAQAIVALDKVQKLSGDNVVKYTTGFEQNSDLFVSAVREVTGPFEATCEAVEQINHAMNDLVVGVRTQLGIAPEN